MEKNNKLNLKIKCNEECFYKFKAEQYKNVIEDFQKNILGNNFMDNMQDNFSKYSDDPILYTYEANNRYIKEYLKILKYERIFYIVIIVLLIALLLCIFL